ncbi:MAG: response regulator receiver modulated diguanylate cyclase [Frankiales bacterium]|nr:response regulator receiver modulated diguanylate cyclase [Frankiales bacterium]
MPAPLVVVADDSATVRAVVRLELEAAGYRVLEAEDGHVAVAAAQDNPVDVMLLDVQMPALDGHQALQQLKSDPRTRDIPVVFLSAASGGDDIVTALREGAHDYLRKSPEPAELLARVAAAYRVKQLQDQLRERAEELDSISRTDHLTGLHNRRHADEHLRGTMAAAARHRFALTVLLVDIDHFKRVNDSRGHSGGDEVLFEVAQVLSRGVRTEDLVARWGGEEFLVVALHTDADAAAVLAERLRRTVEESCGVTISIGGATSSGGSASSLDVADRNLYAAKDAGRNRCLISAVV